jgi:NitT/TauT family transport system substrate-binding protein
MKLRVVSIVTVLALVGLLLAAFFVQAETKVKIQVGVAPTTSSSGFYLAKLRGYFDEQGLDVELIDFGGSGAEMLALIASNKMHVGGGSLTPGIFNAISKGTNLKVVGDKARIIADPDKSHDAVVVRKDLVDSGQWKSVKDFKGMKVAMGSSGKTNAMIIGFDRLLRKHGLTLNDVELIGVKYPAMIAALKGKQVDAACAIEPFITKAEEMEIATRVRGLGETMPNFQVAVVFYSEDFTKKHPEEAKKFMVAYAKGLRDYTNAYVHGVGTEGVTNDLVKVLKVKDKALYTKMRVVGFHPDACVDKKTVGEAIDWYLENGQIKQKVTVDQVVDNSYCEYVREVLGEFKPGQ